MVLMPVPVVFLVLLSVPAPAKLQRLVLRVCSSVLALPALGVFTVFHMGTFVSACAFAEAMWSTWEVRLFSPPRHAIDSPSVQLDRHLRKKLKSPRCPCSIHTLASYDTHDKGIDDVAVSRVLDVATG
jgi:hypothetical protein